MAYIYSIEVTFAIHQLLVRQRVTSARFVLHAYIVCLLIKLHGNKCTVFHILSTKAYSGSKGIFH
jgi:hypothetical protein